MQKLEGKTFNVLQNNIEKLKDLFPEVFTENKVDIDKLRLVLGEHVEKEKERYEFTWNGKTEAIQLSQKQTTGTLIPCKDKSVNWENTHNLYIEGDNLEVLRVLQNSYRNKVKMIYIDPPYNTGSDFIYKDDFHDNIKNYTEKIQESMKSNAETSGRYHTDWLNMMYPRLKIAKNLLKSDGVIFISIDDTELENLKKMCNEIFGEENFIGNIVRATGTTTGQDSGGLGSSFDYVLMYSKTNEFEVGGLPLDENDIARFNLEDKRGKYSVLQLRKTGNADRRSDRPSMFYPVIAPNGDKVFPYGPGGYESRWRMGKEKYEQLVEDDYIYWKEDNDKGWIPYVKYYLEGRSKRPSSLWDDIDGNKKASIEVKTLIGDKLFDFPKPTQLIIRCLQISNVSDNDIVLDFFSGSGTTADALMQFNKDEKINARFIMVQLPEPTDEKSTAYKAGYKNICEIGKERIRRAGKKMLEENTNGIENLDIGFKVFKLNDTNLKLWDEESLDIKKELWDLIDPVKDGRTQEDVVYEILLKYGIDVTAPIEELNVANKTVFSIGLGYLLICLESELTISQIEEMAKLKPARIVFYDEGFKDDTVRTNAQQILKRYGVEDIRVI